MPLHTSRRAANRHRYRKARRAKRPLVVLTYRGHELQELYSSTPHVQFVRLDLKPRKRGSANGQPRFKARPIVVSAIAELPEKLRYATQRVFRQH